MSAHDGPGAGGAALFVSPGRMPRAVAFAPAVRGFPGGIADMAGEPDDYVPDLSFDDDALWMPDTGAGEAEEPAQAAPAPAQAAPAAPAQAAPAAAAQPGSGEPAPGPVSVWQQSAAAWQEAGIDWLGTGSTGAPAAVPADAEDPRTEPIPALSADGTPRPARTAAPAQAPRLGHPGPGREPAVAPRLGHPGPGREPAVAPQPGQPRPGDEPAVAPQPGQPRPGDEPAVAPRLGHPGPGREPAAPGSVGGGSVAGAAGRWAADAGEPRAGKAAGMAGTGGGEAGMAAGNAGPGTLDHAGPGTPSSGAGAPGTPSAGAGAPGSGSGARAGTGGGTTGSRVAAAGRTGRGRGGSARTAAGAGTGEAAGRNGLGRADGAAGTVTATGSTAKATPGRARKTSAGPGRAGAWRGRRAIVVAAAAVVLVAGALAGIGIARSGNGPGQQEFTLVSPIPPVAAADAELAGTAGTTTLQASLTGIATRGKTVIAIGAEPGQPGPQPLFLVSTDSGRTWARAALAGPGAGGGSGTGAVAPPGGPGLTAGPAPSLPAAAGGPGLGTAPGLVAYSGSTWLALGQHAAWTSPDGRTWHQAPGLPPVAGDTVLGLAATGSGFVAVGENTRTQPGPVVWTWSAGRSWERRTGAGLGLTAYGGRATALRWAAGQNGVVVAGGPVTGATGQGRRPEAGLWRTTNGGLTWAPVTLPAGHGATAGLAGVAASGAGFVAVRPGRAAGRLDAVTYQSAQGATWRYASKLTPVRRASLHVTTVSGSGHGFVVAATIRSSQVAFFSARGLGWQQTADPGTGVAGLTAGTSGTLIVARNSQSGTGPAGVRPHLLLIGPLTGRQQVGRAALAAAATPDATVNGLAAAGRTLAAAGASGGSPALWLASAGRWAPARVSLPAAWRDGALTSVVHGAHGWLAIGQAAAPATAAAATAAPARQQPVILTSAAGTSWVPVSGQGPLTAPGGSLVQAAAGPAGYVVVGSATARGSTASGIPVAWYSKNLSTWARAPLAADGNSPAGAAGVHQVLAVTAAGAGFVAVGSAGTGSAGTVPAAWISRSGSAWQFRTVPLPAGTAGAVLTKVTAAGGRVLAAGYAWRPGAAPAAGRPFTAVSPDGGHTWRDSVLPAPPAPAVVTAVTAAGHGFAVVGQAGRVTAGHAGQVMLAWWSSDGLTWQAGAPAGGGPGWAVVTQINAVTAVDGTLTGAGFAAGSAAEHPVLWHARYR